MSQQTSQQASQQSLRSSLWKTLKSVLAAFFGVQSDKNRQHDFIHGKPRDFIIVGLLAGAVFVLLIWGLVNLVIYFADLPT